MGLHIQTCRDHFLFVESVIIGCWVTGFYLKICSFIIIDKLSSSGTYMIKKQVCFIGTLLSWQCIDRGNVMVSFQGNRQLEEGSLTC